MNNTGVLLTRLTPVYSDAAGNIGKVDVSMDAKSMPKVGVLPQDIAALATGNVMMSGRLRNISYSGISFGDVVYVSKTGSLTNVRPSFGVGGFTGGDLVIMVGVIAKNDTNPTLYDILVNAQIVGRL
jgi:hypothetical protein